MAGISSVSSASFKRLVDALKKHKKTITVAEQCCGGVINSSILAQPGASTVFFGGSVIYNTQKSKPLLLNDDQLFQTISVKRSEPKKGETEADVYIQSKRHWTAQTSVAFADTVGTDFCIAEGGASGPTFRPQGLYKGFAVLSIAGRDAKTGSMSVLRQELVRSPSSNREYNMRLFADKAAELATQVVLGSDHLPQEQPQEAISLKFDRATHLRSNPDELQKLESTARYVILKGGNQVLVKTEFELAYLDYATVQNIEGESRKTFLGMLHEGSTPVFGVDLLEGDATVRWDDDKSGLHSFVDTRTTAPLFSVLDNEIALHATAYAQWQRRSGFCALCGAPTTLVEGGTCRRCTSCNAPSWPRQDPSMIAVIGSRCGNKVLLARSPRHPPKLHTVLAGFVEAGETFEAAVARETMEETGVRVDEGSVAYVASQPWPFPQSCMIGFQATADATKPLALDVTELVSADWFGRDDVLRAMEVEGPTMQWPVAEAALKKDPTLPLLIPPQGVIARKLLDRWLEG